MSVTQLTQLARVTAFRAEFARRSAARTAPVPGGFVVLNPLYEASYEHNQLVIVEHVTPAVLPELADNALAHLTHRQVAVLDDAVGTDCAPSLVAAGYAHTIELVMARDPVARVPDADPRVAQVEIADLLPSVELQQRDWLPHLDDRALRQLVERRAARLRGAEDVRFLALRDDHGEVACWADLYLDSRHRVAQVEELVTLSRHGRRGYASAVLDTAIHHGSRPGFVLFLIADAADWPHTWYERRGFTVIGRSHVFTRHAPTQAG